MAIWSSRSNKNSRQLKAAVKNPISPYHCVEVSTSYDACKEVLELHGKRFLSAEAPLLPLSGCDQYCQCKFKHRNDRRQDDRRDSFSSGGIHFSDDKNRRLGGDRRHNSQTHISVG